jgi:hypothetical protein
MANFTKNYETTGDTVDGGRAENQPVQPLSVTNPAPPTKSSGDAFFPKLAGAYNKNLIIALVLVAGYFAYKKFKK